MLFITHSKTNWKFLIIVIALAAIFAAGIFWWQKSSSSPAIQIFSTNPTSSTADWQTYRNEEYGFETQYPEEFMVSSNGPNYSQQELDKGEKISGTAQPSYDTITFSDGYKEVIYIQVFHEYEGNISAEENYKDDGILYVYGTCDIRWGFAPDSIAATSINGADAILVKGINQIEAEESYQECCYLKNFAGNLIVISSMGYKSDISDQILSTFRFIEQNKIFDISCQESSKYFVVRKEKACNNTLCSDFLVKYKEDNQDWATSCEYIVNETDFEIKDQQATYFLGLTDNFLLLDSGTAPPPRGLTVYDLDNKKEVYTDQYSGSIAIDGDVINYWEPTDEEVTKDNCPKLNEYLGAGGGPEIESYISIDLTTLIKKDLGEYRCSVRN